MAKRKGKSCPPCPPSPSREDIVKYVVKAMYRPFFREMNPEEFMEKLRSWGVHHDLMEDAWPETDEQEGEEYSRSIDAFEADLYGWLHDVWKSNMEHLKRQGRM